MANRSLRQRIAASSEGGVGCANESDIPWIAWSSPFEALPPNPQLARLIPDFQPVFTADDYIVQIRAAEAGVGAILTTRSEHRGMTSFVELLILFGKLTSSLHLVCARASLAIPRVKAVADVIAAELTSLSRSVPHIGSRGSAPRA